MSALSKRLDVLTMGRCAVDFYCNDIGVPLKYARSFNMYVGGCPANVAIGTRRLGLKSGILTRVGTEPLGDFIMHFLETEGVGTEAVVRDPRHLSGLVVLGIEPPDKFPLTFYRENCADINLTLDDVRAARRDAPALRLRHRLLARIQCERDDGRRRDRASEWRDGDARP